MTEASAPQKSCSTCPSLMQRADMNGQVETFGMILNAPTCPRRGLLIGAPGANGVNADQKIQDAVGRGCASHGQTMPPLKNRHGTLTVALPNPTIGTGKEVTAAMRPKSCRTCHNFVPAKVMQKEVGITTGYCGRHGKFISEQNTTMVARHCNEAEPLDIGFSNTPEERYHEILADAVLKPELARVLTKGKVIGSNLAGHMGVPSNSEPTEYASDAPVTPEDEAQGIRAWRKLESEDGTREVLLPIFRRDFFPIEEQALIPKTGDETKPELYVDHQRLAYKVAVIWKLNETPALHGVAGTGKTEFFRYMAWMMQLPFHRVSITASSELDDLAGKTHFSPDKGTHFELGRIPKAWMRPCVQVIDEPNVGKPDVWQFIRPMTDNAKQLVLDMDEGRRIDRHPHSYLGMAMNPAWDMRNVGAETIADADGSRLMHIFVDFPNEKLETDIIRQRCELDGFKISKPELKMVMSIARDLRQMAKDQTLPITWGIRPQIKVARLLAWFPPVEAYRLAAADYLEPEAQQLILDVVNNHGR